MSKKAVVVATFSTEDLFKGDTRRIRHDMEVQQCLTHVRKRTEGIDGLRLMRDEKQLC